MSTIVMRDEIKQIADALYWDALGERNLLHCVIDAPCHPCTNSIDDERSMIIAWANRIYVANQIAYIFTYSHRADCDRKIDQFSGDEHFTHGGDLITNKARFYRMLQGVEYNLYSNGGQYMLSHEDTERLQKLMATLASSVIGDYQREKARGV